MSMLATSQPALRAPVPLPADLQGGHGSVTTRTETFTNGGPATADARWLERDAGGRAVGWSLPHDLPSAVEAAHATAAATATEFTVGDEGHTAQTTRWATPLAIVQAADGALFASRLTTAPLSGPDHFASERSSTRDEGAPLSQAAPASWEHVSYADSAPSVRAIVGEGSWFRVGDSASTPF